MSHHHKRYNPIQRNDIERKGFRQSRCVRTMEDSSTKFNNLAKKIVTENWGWNTAKDKGVIPKDMSMNPHQPLSLFIDQRRSPITCKHILCWLGIMRLIYLYKASIIDMPLPCFLTLQSHLYPIQPASFHHPEEPCSLAFLSILMRMNCAKNVYKR